MQEFKSSCDFQNEMNFDSGICVAITLNDDSVKITNTPSSSSSAITTETSGTAITTTTTSSSTTTTTTATTSATKILSSTLTTNKNVINYYKRIEEFQKILYNLQRDKEFRDLQRKHLSQILERKSRKIIREICNVCFVNLDREDPKTCTSCCNCKKYICRGQNCSIWIPNQAEWECRLCYLSNESRSRTSEWINRQQQQNLLTHKFSHSMKNIRSGLSTPIHNYDGDYHNLFNSLEHYRSSPHLSSLDEREKIRRYVEETISQILGGGSLDDVSVGQLYDNKEYLKLFHKYHSSLSKKLYSLENSIFRLHKSLGDLPQHENYLRNDYAGVSNIKLRKLIEDIIEETHNLPPLIGRTTPPTPPTTTTTAAAAATTTNEQNNSNNRISLNRNENVNENLQYFDPKKYQELLATAVLNKIVNTYNCERKIDDNSSEILSTLSINLDNNDNTVTSKNNKSCSQSSSSIEPQSDSSLTDLANDLNHCHDISPSDSFSNICGDRLNQNYTDDESILNDYVKKHQIPLPALSISSESADEDFASIATSNGQEGTWEDNWLFKRKKLGADTSVGMLVPAPKEDIKALIGDKSADEMSDLSEAGSDYEDVNNNVDSLEPTNVRIHNQNVISGKDNIGLFDELIEQTSLISTSSLPENEPIFMETKNDFVLGNDGLNEIDNPKLSLSTGSVPSIKNEAVNVNVASKISNDMKKTILHQTSVGNFEEPIIDPPNDFTDDQIKQKTTNKANKVNSLNSLPTDLTNAEKNFQDITNLSTNENSNTTNNNFESSLDDFERLNSESTNTSRKHSAIEFLAAIALGPVLAFSTSELDEKVIHIPEKNFCDDSNQTTKNKDIPAQPTVIENESNIKQRIILETKREQNTNQYDVRTISKEYTREVLKEISPITNKNDALETKQQFDDNIMKNSDATAGRTAITEKSVEEKPEQQNISPSYNNVEASGEPVSESIPTTKNTTTDINVKHSTDVQAIVDKLSTEENNTLEQQQPNVDTFESSKTTSETESIIEKTTNQIQDISHSPDAEITLNESEQEKTSEKNSTKTTKTKKKTTSASEAMEKLSFETHENCSSKTKQQPAKNTKKNNNLEQETQNICNLCHAEKISHEHVQELDKTINKTNTTLIELEDTSEIVVDQASKTSENSSSETQQIFVDDTKRNNDADAENVTTHEIVGIVQKTSETKNTSNLSKKLKISNKHAQSQDKTTEKPHTAIVEAQIKISENAVDQTSKTCEYCSSEPQLHFTDYTIRISGAETDKISTTVVVEILQDNSETQNNSNSFGPVEISYEHVREENERVEKSNTTIVEPEIKISENAVNPTSKTHENYSSETQLYLTDYTIRISGAVTENVPTTEVVEIVQEKSETQNILNSSEDVYTLKEYLQQHDKTVQKTITTLIEPETKISENFVDPPSKICENRSSETQQHLTDYTIRIRGAETDKIPTTVVVEIVQDNSETQNISHSSDPVEISNENVREKNESVVRTNTTIVEPEIKISENAVNPTLKTCENYSSETQLHLTDYTIRISGAVTENVPISEVVEIVQEKSETQNILNSSEDVYTLKEYLQQHDETVQKRITTPIEPETTISENFVDPLSKTCENRSSKTQLHLTDYTIRISGAETDKIPTTVVVEIVQEKSETQNNSHSSDPAEISDEHVRKENESVERSNTTIVEPEIKISENAVNLTSKTCENYSSETQLHLTDYTIRISGAETKNVPTTEVVEIVQEKSETQNILNRSKVEKTITTPIEQETTISENVVDPLSKICENRSSETQLHLTDYTIRISGAVTENVPTTVVVEIVQNNAETQNILNSSEDVYTLKEYLQQHDETVQKRITTPIEPETTISENFVDPLSKTCENRSLETQLHLTDYTIRISGAVTENLPTFEVVEIVKEKSETENISHSSDPVEISYEHVREKNESVVRTNTTIVEPEIKISENAVNPTSKTCENYSSETQLHLTDYTIRISGAVTENLPTLEVVEIVKEKSETENISHSSDPVEISYEHVREENESVERSNTTIVEPEIKISKNAVDSTSKTCENRFSETHLHFTDYTIRISGAETDKIPTTVVVEIVQEKSEAQNNLNSFGPVEISYEHVREEVESEIKISENAVDQTSETCENCSSETQLHLTDYTIRISGAETENVPTTEVVEIMQEKSETQYISNSTETAEFSTNDADTEKISKVKVVEIAEEISETQNISKSFNNAKILNEYVQEPNETVEKTSTFIVETESKLLDVVPESHEYGEPKTELQSCDKFEKTLEESVQSHDITLLSNVVEDSGNPSQESITFIENANSDIAAKELAVETSSTTEQYFSLETKPIRNPKENENTTSSIGVLTENISMDIITYLHDEIYVNRSSYTDFILPVQDENVCLDSTESVNDAIKTIDTYSSVQYKTSKDPQQCNVLKTTLKDSIFSTLPLSSSGVIQSFENDDSLSDQIIFNKTNILVKNIISSDHCSSDSNSSDGSTSTVIDANEVLNQIVIESFIQEEKRQTSLVPSKVIPISITNTTNQTNNTSAINDDLKIQNLESECSNEDDYFNDSLPPLLPGSVAERERKKWLNAVDMPNNPYSPDALRRRLSDGPEKHIDIPNPILERASSEEKQISSTDNTNDVRLQVDSKAEYEKYSRDYYINNDNINYENNNNKRTTTQLNKNDNERIVSNEEKVSTITPTTTTSSSSSSLLQKNYSDNDKLSKNSTSDIYLAKIVHVEEYNKKINEQNNTEIESSSDNLLKKNNKKLTINNSNNNNNLLNLNCDSDNDNDYILKSPITPITPVSSSSLLNHQDGGDSLTPSEDSDTIRIYDLNKQETRIIKDDKTINDINKSTRPRILSFTTKLLSKNSTTSSSANIKKIVTPAALKFLQPKRKIFEPEQIMSDNEGTSSPIFEKREITPNTPNANKVPEKNVIEPEVAQALPSVKALAKAFLLTSAKCSTKHPERPRTRSTTSENGLNNNEKIKPSPDSYSPPYEQVTYSPIGPIASQQQENDSNNNGTFKTEENDNICISSDINNDDNNNDNELERPISPVLEPGKLKDNIAFFENLKKN